MCHNQVSLSVTNKLEMPSCQPFSTNDDRLGSGTQKLPTTACRLGREKILASSTTTIYSDYARCWVVVGEAIQLSVFLACSSNTGPKTTTHISRRDREDCDGMFFSEK